uniref:Protein kinase domain-containing protein n=1 Tax=Oryzias latipes TaxID=8090 RepID=A0A3B3H821_ORYLA
MKHLAGKSKAMYAGTAEEAMGKTPPSEAQVNPSASSSSSRSGSSNKSLQSSMSDRETVDMNKAIESRKGKRKTKVFKLMEGHCLDGNQGIYKVQEFLGNGSFGNVVKCTKLGSQECYAIKIMNCSRAGQEEFEMMKLIKDLDPDENHLIKMFECFTFHSVTCIVYELLDVSLFDSYKRDSSTRTHLCLIRVIAQQLLKALKALKSIGVAHCDITLDNIMFTDPDSVNVKLIDFGLAVETKKLSTETDIQVTPFRAPEVILGLPLDESVDMWALGVVLACVYFGNYPFPSKTEYETIRAMEYTETTGQQVEIKNHVINLDNMLEVNPQNRITPIQALEHDFITMKHLAGKIPLHFIQQLGFIFYFFSHQSASKNPSESSCSVSEINSWATNIPGFLLSLSESVLLPCGSSSMMPTLAEARRTVQADTLAQASTTVAQKGHNTTL